MTTTAQAEKIEPGQEIPSLTKDPIIVRQLAMFAAATAEFVDIHYDKGFAQANGLPDTIIQGWYKTAMIGQMLKDWTGDGTVIKRMNIQHRAMDVSGSTLKACGKVINIVRDEKGRKIECEVWIENQQGKHTSTGTAELLLTQ